MRARLPFFLLLIPAALPAQDFSALDAAAGHALFERNWVAAPASPAASDGLGPYYNARSCAACHADGAGGDATLATMNLVVGDPVYGDILQLRAVTGMKSEVQAELALTVVEQVLLPGGAVVDLSRPTLLLSGLRHGHDAATLAAATSLRRAPNLHGLALLERVPLEQLQAHADPDDHDNDGISGRLAAHTGRFGWRGTASTLREQVARALSLDLGLGTPQFPSAAGDCTEQQLDCRAAARAVTGDAVEAPAIVIDLLLAYLGSLPSPATPTVGEGATVFAELGCAACHAPQVDVADQQLHPFSDLLLHDMGPGLADAGGSEWRTAPLWNLGKSERLLHDGRAASLDEAVLWHGGEASASSEAYRKLNPPQRAVLHDWLLGL